MLTLTRKRLKPNKSNASTIFLDRRLRVSLYLDEDSHSNSLIHALRYRGLDVTTAREAQMLGSTDLEQLDWATAHGRVLYSFNIRDFFRLHSDYLTQGKSHAGIVLAQQQLYSIGEQMRRLLKLVAVRSAEGMIDQVEFLGGWG